MNIDSLSEADFSHWFYRMPEKKQAEVISCRKEIDKKRSVCGYMLAVKALSEFLRRDENDISIGYDENGKPFSEGAYLSIAHTGNYAVCAVSDTPCGIDAETKDRRVSLKTALRVCTENELKYIFGENFDGTIPEIKDDETVIRFIEIWTKKEAYGKMLGKGIVYDMKNTDVTYIETKHDGELIISAVGKR